MKQNFETIFAETKVHEGGYVDHPTDPGGATNMGITFAVLKAWRGKNITKQDVKNLTEAEAKTIYKAQYWHKVWGDELPSGIDSAIFDFAVNSGVSRSVKYAQEIVGVKADGVMGPNTLAALRKQDPATFINKFIDKREAFLKGLKIFPTFGKGWLRRTARVRTFSLSLVGVQATEKPADRPKAVAQGVGSGTLIAVVLALLKFLFGRK